MFLKNRNIIFKMKISKVTEYAALSSHSKRPKIGFQYRLSLNAGQKYNRVFCNTFGFIKLPLVIKIFVLSFFEWTLKTVFTVFVLIFTWQCLHYIPSNRRSYMGAHLLLNLFNTLRKRDNILKDF